MLKKLKSLIDKNHPLENTNNISFEVLPAERKSRPAVALCIGCTSCCCCCCCVHTAGGVIGAAIATKAARSAVSNIKVDLQQANQYNYNQQNEIIKNTQASVQRLTWVYWIVLLVCSLVSFLISLLLISEVTITSVVYFALVLPILQIVAFFLTLPFLAIVPDRSAGFKALLKILLGSVVGMVLGIMGMITGAIIIGVF